MLPLGLGAWTWEEQGVCVHVLAEEPGSATGGLGGRGKSPGRPWGGELRYGVGTRPWRQSPRQQGQATGEASLRLPVGV